MTCDIMARPRLTGYLPVQAGLSRNVIHGFRQCSCQNVPVSSCLRDASTPLQRPNGKSDDLIERRADHDNPAPWCNKCWESMGLAEKLCKLVLNAR